MTTISTAGTLLLVSFIANSASAKKVYVESEGLVIMEVENTESDLGAWQLIETDAENYPAGAKGISNIQETSNGVCPIRHWLTPSRSKNRESTSSNSAPTNA